MTTRAALFDAVRPFAPDRRFTSEHVQAIDALANDFGLARLEAPAGPLTARVVLELAEHEAIVPEAYLDSVKVWTWAMGLTDASGIKVAAYKDNPRPLAECLAAVVDRLRKVYVPQVQRAFGGAKLTEAQFAAALSFHYNTGAIERADWVKLWRAGNVAGARASIMNWRSPAEIIPRREAERDLFFDGKWAQTGKALVIPVRKPSYQPNFAAAKRVDIRADVEKALAA